MEKLFIPERNTAWIETATFTGQPSHIVIGGLPLGLPQSDLQSRKSAHGHMEKDLPKVAQFIEIHVAQADQAKS